MLMSRILCVLAPAFLLSACATTGKAPSAATPETTMLARPAFTVKSLIGLDAAALDRRLGAPALVRREGAGEFRRYSLASCALIVILYPDEKGVQSAAHLDSAAMRSGEEKPDLNICLAKGLAPSS
ncbi:MAG: hypothetical protein AB7P23_07250 [Amphiplicatus sp.]